MVSCGDPLDFNGSEANYCYDEHFELWPDTIGISTTTAWSISFDSYLSLFGDGNPYILNCGSNATSIDLDIELNKLANGTRYQQITTGATGEDIESQILCSSGGGSGYPDGNAGQEYLYLQSLAFLSSSSLSSTTMSLSEFSEPDPTLALDTNNYVIPAIGIGFVYYVRTGTTEGNGAWNGIACWSVFSKLTRPATVCDITGVYGFSGFLTSQSSFNFIVDEEDENSGTEFIGQGTAYLSRPRIIDEINPTLTVVEI